MSSGAEMLDWVGGGMGVVALIGTPGFYSLLTVMEHVTLPNWRCRFKLPQEVIFFNVLCSLDVCFTPPDVGSITIKVFKQSNGM